MISLCVPIVESRQCEVLIFQAAHLIPHMCTICLYEPFGDITDPTDPATRRLSSATTAIVSIIQEIAAGSGTNSDFSTIMHSSASV